MLIQDSFIKRKEGDILTMNPYDLCLKEIFSNKQHFADLFSSAYFKKRLLLDPDKLSLYDKETHHDLGFRKENDLLMFYDNMFFLHLEFQRKKDPYMPVRILNYKYAGIHQQIKTDTKLHLLYPVYSLTLYMGELTGTKMKSRIMRLSCLTSIVILSILCVFIYRNSFVSYNMYIKRNGKIYIQIPYWRT